MKVGGQCFDVPCLAFPHDKDFPAGITKLSEISFISFNISKPFFLPEFFVSGWCNFAVTAVVDMPETAMNKDDFFMAWQNDIRMAEPPNPNSGLRGETLCVFLYSRKMLAHKNVLNENATLKMFEF